jgi:DNA-binding FadR family transcriptional regulator
MEFTNESASVGSGDGVESVATEPALDIATSNQILGLVKGRGLRPGDKLPTEAEIAQVFAMPRQKVRAGLLRLESLGIVRSRQGSGRVLLDRVHHTLPGLLTPSLEHSPADVLDAVIVRQVLEVGFLPSAIEAIDSEAISRMRAAVEGMQQRAAEGKSFSASDRDFHDALYAGLNNHLLSRLLNNFWELLDGIDLEVLRHCETADEIIRHHRNILEAVERGEVGVGQFHLKMHFYDSVESLRDFSARS